MRRLLYIAFFFPPLGGAGVQRTLKFVRYLPAHGWQPTVVTGDAPYWLRDPSLLREVDPAIHVIRVSFTGARFLSGGSPPPTAGGAAERRSRRRIAWLRAGARLLFVPDAYVGWAVSAGRRARQEMAVAARRGVPYAAFVTTSSPDSTHWIGRRLKRATGLPWIADFRDPWTRRLSYHPPTGLHHEIHRRMERACLLSADRVIVTNEETKSDFVARSPGLDPAKVAVIPNGYDEDDFAAAETWLSEGGDPPVSPVLHAGQLNPERPIDPFLAGLSRLREEDPELARQARTLFLGGFYDDHVRAVRGAGLEDLVELSPGRPHREAVAALLKAKVLLLLEQDSDRGRLVLPGKVFEYLRAERPILAVVPKGGAADRLVRSLDAGLVVEPSRPDAIAAGLDRLLRETVEAPVPSASRSALKEFERRSLTARLAALLDQVARL